MFAAQPIILIKMVIRGGVLGTLLLPTGLSAVSQGCKKGEILVAEDAHNYYCLVSEDYNQTRGPQLAAQYCSAKKVIGADQSALHNLNFANDADRYELYTDVAKSQQAELKNRVMMALVSQALVASDALAQSAKSLNPYNVNNAAKLLEEKGFGNAQLISALRAVAAVRGKPEMAAAYSRFVQTAQMTLNGYGTGSGVEKDPATAQLQLLAGALKTVQGNYELGLVITTAQFGESLAYLYYVGGQIDDLANATDDKLGRVAALGSRLKGHVEDMVAARQAWQAETGVPSAPSCRR